MNTTEPVIELIDVSLKFADQIILDSVSLTVYRGETVVIFGPGGCGKTTLLKLCDGLIRPDAGVIRIDGEDITTMKETALDRMRMKCGMLFQYYALFDSMSVEDNVGFFLREHHSASDSDIKKRVTEYLKMVNLEGINHLRPNELSGGMQKRVGIARAIIHQPQIVFYDSPTDGLDPVTAEVINDLIIELNRAHSVTSLTISNDMNTALKIGTRLGMLYEGKIIQMGTPDEIRNSRNPYIYQFIRGLWEGPIAHP